MSSRYNSILVLRHTIITELLCPWKTPLPTEHPLLDQRIPRARQLLGRLVDAHEPQKVVLQHEQVQHDSLGVPRDSDDTRARNGVEHEVVGRGDDGCQDEARVGHAADDQGHPLPAAELDGHRGHGEADEERVAEVEGWHGRCGYTVSAWGHDGDGV